MSKKQDLNKVAETLFKAYPEKIKVFITSDGQGFWTENPAINHANKNKLEYKAFFREGYQVEDNSDVEDLLISSEEKVRTLETVLDTIQDVANVEVEDAIEVDENTHEAVKATVELRLKYEEAVEKNTGGDESKDEAHKALVTSLATLIKGNKSKLAANIIKLLPEQTEV